MNSKLDNEMKTGPLSLGDQLCASGINMASSSGLAARMAQSVGDGQTGGAVIGGGGAWLTACINAVCDKTATLTIGQHIDQRIASLTEQLQVMEGIKSELAQVGALGLPVQTMRDALY